MNRPDAVFPSRRWCAPALIALGAWLAIEILFVGQAMHLDSFDVLESALRTTRFGGIVRESLLIGGWVAMWKPLEVFLYDWWPIRDEARLFDRLSAMRVQIERDSASRATAARSLHIGA